MYAASLDDIRAAAVRIAPYAHRTPVMTCAAIDERAGCAVFLKCENLQKIGAFKVRGALNAILRLSDDEAARGVVTHSSGNHAQAVAFAARIRGISATIVMPTSAPEVKRRAVAGYGAQIVSCEPTLLARETTAADVVAQTGATLVHAYDHPDVIAGQGTVALELLDQVEGLDTIVAPVGGGGLVSGIAIAARGRVRVFAAEPSGADDAARSKAAGYRIPSTEPQTIADGLLTSLGGHTWPVVRDLVEEVVVVEDDAIRQAMRLVYERVKLVIEPSAAVSLAAVLSGAVPGARVGVVLSGGNLDLDPLFL